MNTRDGGRGGRGEPPFSSALGENIILSSGRLSLASNMANAGSKDFDETDGVALVKKQPSPGRVTQTEEHGGRGRGARLGIEPDAVPRRCVDGFSVSDWRKFLLKAKAVPAELLEKCPWGEFNGFDWSELLFGKKELGRYCQWETFDEDDWRIIMFFHPEYRNEFDLHSGLKYKDLHVEDPGPIAWL